MTTRILLVEDNRADARLLEEHLREVAGQPFVLTHVESLRDGITSLDGHDVVLLDLSLPDAAGLDTVTKMVSAARALPIIVLTGTRDDRTALEAVAAGAQDYLQKDELTAALIAKSVRYAIERKKAEEQAQRVIALEIEQHKTNQALERARFLADVTAAASTSVQLDESMSAVAKLLVPTLADCCAIDLPRGGSFDRVAFAAREGEQLEGWRDRCSELGPRNPDSPVYAAVAQRKTVLMPDFADTTTGSVQPRSLLITPLVARDNVVAIISYVMGPSGRRYGAEDQLLAEELAGRVALAIDNGRLFADAQRAIHGRDELLAVVSHDLRNPLGVVDLALDLLVKDSTHAKNALPRAQRAVDRMKRLIDDLLEVSRIDAGTLAVETGPTDLTLLLDDVYEQHRPLCAEKNLRLARDYGELGIADIDKHRIAQVLGNVLGNAIKFTPSDGTITLGAFASHDSVTVVVTDTGAGISPEHLAHIFDRFWQAPGRNRRSGVGLGLAIVKGIVDAHRGSITVDSALGRGTMFRITLPR